MGEPGTDRSQDEDFLSLENDCSMQRRVFIFLSFLFSYFLVWIFEAESLS